MKTDEASSTRPPLAERLRRGDMFAEGCPSRDVMKHVTSSWGVLVLIALQDGTMRFSALRRRVSGVSERMLSQTLQWLEGDGLIVRRAYPVIPPHTEYSLTDLGREGAEKVAALADWIEEKLPQMMKDPSSAEPMTPSGLVPPSAGTSVGRTREPSRTTS